MSSLADLLADNGISLTNGVGMGPPDAALAAEPAARLATEPVAGLAAEPAAELAARDAAELAARDAAELAASFAVTGQVALGSAAAATTAEPDAAAAAAADSDIEPEKAVAFPPQVLTSEQKDHKEAVAMHNT